MPKTSTSKRCGYHKVMTMVRSHLGGTHPHTSNAGITTNHAKNSFGRFTSHICGDRLDMFAIKATLDKSRPIVCIIQKLTHLESRTQQEGNPHESETKIARRDKQTFSPQNTIGEHIITKKPTWWHTSSQSSAGIYTSMRNNAGHTKLRGDLIVTALDQTQPTWCILALQWWNLFMIHAKNSVGRVTSNIYAHLLNMFATVARQTTPMRCPMQYEQTLTHALTSTKKQQTNTSHIDYRSTRHGHD